MAGLDLDGDDLDPLLRCQLRLRLADSLAMSGSFDDARPHYREALDRTRSLDVPRWSLAVLNNWAYTELVADRPDAAAELVEQLLAVAREHGASLDLGSAGTVAEVLHARGRSDEAVSMLRESLRAGRRRAPFDIAGCWLVLAQIERETGDLEAAEVSLDVAEEVATAHDLHGLRAEELGARAGLLAARGDFAGAYQTHRRFHARTLRLRSQASDARAQTLHAVYEVDQARRESVRYREMSYRDALTGLYNRRHVDEDLGRRLVRGTAVAVAMVDLDHFKRVNDTCSHEAGDAVLVRLAALLGASAVGASPDAYAARLGGEEFLLVLPGAGPDSGHDVAEEVRRQVAALDWHDIAPAVTVTVSIGLAATTGTAPHQPDRAALLREADHHLYAAKAAGRNRVEPVRERLGRACGSSGVVAAWPDARPR